MSTSKSGARVDKAGSSTKQTMAPFYAGVVSGLTTSVALQPLDVVKTRMQAIRTGHMPGANSWGMGAVAREIVHKEGVRALWTGVGPGCLRIGAGAGLYFIVLDRLRSRLKKSAEAKKSPTWLNTLQLAGAGSLARAVSCIVLCPVTVVKTRMEYAGVTGVKYGSTLGAIVDIARRERLKGLFSGLGPTLLRDLPYAGMHLALYTNLQETLHPLTPYIASQGVNFLGGCLAGATATLLTHPPDVLRTRRVLQQRKLADAASTAAAAVPPRISLMSIARAEGLQGLLSGCGPRLLRRTLHIALSWTMYEELVKHIGHALEQRRD